MFRQAYNTFTLGEGFVSNALKTYKTSSNYYPMDTLK